VQIADGVWVFWKCNHEHEELSRVLDLSLKGLFVETPRLKTPGINTKLHFLVEEGQIRADAVVRHVKPGSGMGMKFSAISEQDRPHLAALINRLRGLARSSGN
jgi:hypothetical protein